MTDAHDKTSHHVLNLAEAHVVSRLNELVARFGIHPADSQMILGCDSINHDLPVFIGFHHTEDDADGKKLDKLSAVLLGCMREMSLPCPDENENEVDELRFSSYRVASNVIDVALKRAPRIAPQSRAK